MDHRRRALITNAILLLIVLLVSGGCNTTRHLPEGKYLLRSNTIKLRTDQSVTRKSDMKDNLGGLIIQKPNTYIFGIIPLKLWLYNNRYEKYKADTTNFQLKSKTVEPPVIYDSSTIRRTALNMKSYLFNQGYFYATITDTTKFSGKKAFVTYNVNAGINYLVNRTIFDINDTIVENLVKKAQAETVLKPGTEFNYSLLEQEQSRLTSVLRDNGYYKFTNNNISFELDTLNKSYLKNDANAIESTIDILTLRRKKKKPTLDVKVIIRADEDPAAYYRYGISRVRVFPDYEGRGDFRDSTMIQKTIGKVTFRYHNYYIKESIIFKHLFVEADKYYAQDDYDLTISKLNELGVFQSIRIVFSEDTARGNTWLNANVFLTPAERYDFNTSIEASTGNTYAVGSAATVVLRNRNFAKGANMLSLTLNGGIELRHDSIGSNFFDRFHLRTRSVGANLSLDVPKFLVPFKFRGMSNKNIPRTEIGVGSNLLDRVGYFTLINSSVNYTYRWRETSTKRWELSPAFINLIRLPRISTSFDSIIQNNSFLRNTYKRTLIEGENAAFIFSDREKRPGRDYSYVRISGEEAGGLLTGVNTFVKALDTQYSQYFKFDFDAQHFFLRRHSTIALRFYGGIGIPYDKSETLPYIKQYFAGGPYSMRGWAIRSLGPGSYFDPNQQSDNVIDRTGDIKLELNAEYRFDIISLFTGAINLKGAAFADAGNIWLARKTKEYPNGEFAFNKLGKDLAIDAGMGLRIDIAGFFLLRFDYALPVKNPAYTTGEIPPGWVDDILMPGTWALQNLRFAVGYPF